MFVNFGLRLNMIREFNDRRTLNADFVTLNFSENGLKNLSFVGQKIFTFQDDLLRFEGEEKEGGIGWLGWTGIVVGGGFLNGRCS